MYKKETLERIQAACARVNRGQSSHGTFVQEIAEEVDSILAETIEQSSTLGARYDVVEAFDYVRRTNVERCGLWHPGFPNTPWKGADWSNAMCGEAGEFANVVKKLRRIECGATTVGEKSRDELVSDLADEGADVFLYLELTLAYYGIPAYDYIARKFNRKSNEQGFPQKLARLPHA